MNQRIKYHRKRVQTIMNGIAIVQGIVLGVAAVLPGFSTSVAAVLMGMYEKLIGAIDSLRKDFKNSFKYLLPLGIGAVIGILISVKLILKVCELFPVQSYFFFAGLVLGGVPLVFRKMKQVKFNPAFLLITIGAFLILFFISMTNETGAEKNFIDLVRLDSPSDFLTMLFAGAFSVSLMAIPGVSGSIMLIIIGQYGTIYNSASMAIDMVIHLVKGDMLAFREALDAVLLLIPFCIGALLGVILIAKLLNFLLKKYEAAVYYGVLGILISSIVTLCYSAIFESWPVGQTTSGNAILAVICVVCVVIGVVCTIFLDTPDEKKSEKKQEEEKISSETKVAAETNQ